jgi:hypothetical protein
MPTGYGLLAPEAGSGLMPWSRVEEQLVAARNYWVATTYPDGRPHVMPVWGVWFEGAFYFGTDPHSRKGRNLAANPAIMIHLESGDDVVILEGMAEEIRDLTQLEPVFAAYEAKYHINLAGEAGGGGPMYALRPQKAFAWLETDFPGGATRWQFT